MTSVRIPLIPAISKVIADGRNEGHTVGMQLVSTRQLLGACAAGVVPFFATNLAIIAFHDGGFIHMTKLELVFATVAGSIAIWLALAAVLCVLVFVSRGNRWLFALLCAVLLYGLPPFIQPHFWSFEFWSEDPVNEPAVWFFVSGVASSLVTLYLANAGRRSSTVTAKSG